MTIVRRVLPPASGGDVVMLRVPRETLAKRRWRGVAEDGAEFGFDLEEPLGDGAVIHRTEGVVYAIRQMPEPVLEVALPGVADAAWLGWMIGNLHFALEIGEGVIQVADDPALRQMFVREGIVFSEKHCVFRPMSGSSGHPHRH